MATFIAIKARFSLFFVCALQVLHAIYGYSWWLVFSGFGPLFLCVPVTSTYGGAVMVVLDDARGYRYTSDWARVFTAAFLGFMLTLVAVAVMGLLVLGLGLMGIFV